MAASFSVELVGAFYTSIFYDEKGRAITDLDTAASEAERQFGDGWACVFNGNISIAREDWLKRSACTP